MAELPVTAPGQSAPAICPNSWLHRGSSIDALAARNRRERANKARKPYPAGCRTDQRLTCLRYHAPDGSVALSSGTIETDLDSKVIYALSRLPAAEVAERRVPVPPKLIV